MNHAVNVSPFVLRLSSVLNEFRESSHCSQDSMREDSFVSSTGPDQYSETAIFSCSDSETQGPPTPSQDQAPLSLLSESEQACPSEEEVEEENPVTEPPPPASEVNLDAAAPSPPREPAEEAFTAAHDQASEAGQEDSRRSASLLSRTSSEPLPVSMFKDI